MPRQWLIGRGSDCDVVISQASVSSHHCRLTEAPTGFVLEDLGSSNGTHVNGVRIAAPTLVAMTDRVTLGQNIPLPWPARSTTPRPPAPTSTNHRIPAASQATARSATPRPPAPLSPGTRVIRIGRASDNDVVLDYAAVSARHAQVTVTSDGQATIEDLGSTNGTALNRPDRKITRAQLTARDTVYFGSLHLPAARLLQGTLQMGAQPAVAVSVRQSAIVFGRDPSCEQPLNYPMISARHAQLARHGSQLVLEDLGSTNGTYVNGRRIRRVLVQPGDVIGLGSYTFTLNEAGELQKRDYRGNVSIEARAVTVDVPGRRLLEDVSLTIFPSEFVGLMGPSGAGKTTLMNVLNGYTRPTAGDVLLNGRSLYANYAHFASHIGYVPQDDIIHRDLTVGAALYYTARLRLPRDFSDGDIHLRIADVLKQLELDGTEGVLIGSPEKKGISGGQRKRVNLAMELLTDPLVLFLDEPTSGLSSEDALTVMRLLRGLADAGKTILLTIHQPSLEVYRLMDNLALVARASKSPGRLVYYGLAYPDAVQFFNPSRPETSKSAEPSPDEILRGLKQRSADEWATVYGQWEQHREYVEQRAGKSPPAATGSGEEPRRPWFDVGQWYTLVRRCLVIKLTDTWNTAILLAQAPIIGLLVWVGLGAQLRSGPGDPATDFEQHQLFAGGVSSAIFLMALAGLWFGCSNAVREIVGEWAVYRRERMVNLSIPAYVASKFTVLGGLCLLQCSVLLGIAYFGCALEGPFLPMYGLLVLGSLAGTALGLTISAAARTTEMAIAIVPVVLLPMVMFSGVLLRIHNLGPVGKGMCTVAASRWVFEGLFVMESDARGQCMSDLGARQRPAGATPEQKKDVAEGWFPQNHQKEEKNHRVRPRVCAAVLGGMIAVLTAAILAILRLRDIH